MSESSSVVNNVMHTGLYYKKAYDKMMGNGTTSAKIANLLGNVVLLTVFVIGYVGAAQSMSSFAMGWTVVGLGVTYFGMKLLACKLQDRKIDVLYSLFTTALVITFASLGVTGIFTATQTCYALTGTVLATAFVSLHMMICAKRRAEKKLPNTN